MKKTAQEALDKRYQQEEQEGTLDEFLAAIGAAEQGRATHAESNSTTDPENHDTFAIPAAHHQDAPRTIVIQDSPYMTPPMPPVDAE